MLSKVCMHVICSDPFSGGIYIAINNAYTKNRYIHALAGDKLFIIIYIYM